MPERPFNTRGERPKPPPPKDYLSDGWRHVGRIRVRPWLGGLFGLCVAEELMEHQDGSAEWRRIRRPHDVRIPTLCDQLGHAWDHTGGSNCGCPDGGCSVPVYTCTRCGYCDYGQNAEATEIRAVCGQREGI